MNACDACGRSGWSCGFGAVADEKAPCVRCGEPTAVRSACGAARTAWCGTGKATLRLVQAAEEADYGRLRLLAALEDRFPPTRRVDGRTRRPYWRPELPAVAGDVRVTAWSWSRPYTGKVAVLDRSGAWISAASSVLVAHGELVHTGDQPFIGRPGMYRMTVYPWPADEARYLPHPLGVVPAGVDSVWVPAPRVKLLHKLATAGRWPEAEPLDSYTGDGVRLTDWAGHVNKLRADTIRTHGRDSAEYDAVKVAFSQAVALMIGSLDGVRRVWRCGVQRPDWAYAIQDQAAVTIWQWADDCRKVCPEAPPVALRNVDELILPAEAVDVVTTTKRGHLPPLAIDPEGIKLGTFKIKDIEDWS